MAAEISDAQTMKVIELIEVEIGRARQEHRVISRSQLAGHAAQRLGLSAKQVEHVVDFYCDEHAPGIPGFLSKDVESPVLKMAALINCVLLVVASIVGLYLANRGLMAWPAFVVAGIFFLVAIVTYLKSTQ